MSSTTNQRTKKQLPIHPVCKMVPSMNAEAFANLKSDIQRNELLEAIWIIDGKILDGRHRYKACLELGVEPAFREYSEPLDPETFVLATNLSRRHLTRQQRAGFIKRVLKLHPEKSGRTIAAMVGSSDPWRKLVSGGGAATPTPTPTHRRRR